MVYSPETDYWIDIYNCSGAIAAPTSVYGGTRLHTKNQYAFESGLSNVGKRLLTDYLFWNAALGSNEKTAVYGSAQPSPDTTGGHVDTASRRMISNIGCEETNGLQWQWLDEIGPVGGGEWRSIDAFDGAAGTFGNSVFQPYCLEAGGDWDAATNNGSFARRADHARATVDSISGGRGCSPCARFKY